MVDVTTLGDPHLGKKFETGVPLHRRGDREAMQLAEFEAHLMAAPPGLHICMGDIFDKMIVPYTVVYRAAMAYRRVVEANPNTTYAVIRGNHDASRDADRVSAFQIFAELVRPYGVMVADEEPVFFADWKVVLLPWHPFITAEEMLDYPHSTEWAGCTAFGHWDVVMGDTNQLPVRRLEELGVVRAVTGHDHNKRELVMDGLPVTVTGSMQPYSHSEDSAGRLYVTCSLAQVLADPEAYRDKCLRVRLGPDEVLDQAIDCLQLTIQKGDVEAMDLGEVDFEAFDLAALFDQARAEVGLDEEFGAVILQRLEAERAAYG